MSEIYENIKHGLSTIINDIHGDKHYAGVIDSLSDMYTSYTGAIKIMFMGGFSVGKSSLINTILKRDIADISAVPTTSAITVFRYGADEKFIVHYSDGKQENGKLEDLSVYTSELARKTAVDKIQMVECFLNENILMKYTFIDSPGLNANKEHHNDITLNFVNMADAVLWVFDAHWAAGNDDVQHMRALPERLKPLVVINQIDVLDEDEGDDVEEFLAEIKLKCGDAAIDVVGVSAEMAKYGQEYNNAACLQESNLDGLMEAVKKYTCGKYEVLKIQHLIESFGAETDNILQCKDKSDRYRVWGLEKKNYTLFLERFTVSRSCGDDFKNLADLFCASAQRYLFVQECVDIANKLEDKVTANINEFLGKREYLCQALEGTAEAQYALAEAYIEKYGENYEVALYWLKLAEFECDILPALQILYKHYEERKFLDIPSNTMELIYEKAAEQGDLHAADVLTTGLYLGINGITKNIEKSISWLEKQIQNTSCIDRNLYIIWLAKECVSGNNMVKNETRIFELLKKIYATDHGMVRGGGWPYEKHFMRESSQTVGITLGDMYCKGIGTSIDLMQAYKIYEENGMEGQQRINEYFINDNYDFQINIAHEYMERGHTENYHKAGKWYEIAYSHGNDEAAFYLGKVSVLSNDYVSAISWYKKYEETNPGGAGYRISELYNRLEGRNVDWRILEKIYKQYDELKRLESLYIKHHKHELLGDFYIEQKRHRWKAIVEYILAKEFDEAFSHVRTIEKIIFLIICACCLLPIVMYWLLCFLLYVLVRWI